MSMMYSTADALLSPHDIIFSCSICQATISEIYATPQGDKGFNSDSDCSDKQRVVTKLWLTECSHLTCALHLEGGGVPFHSKDKKPSAPCPLCVAERSDSTPKLLFRIVGAEKGEHDQDVPEEYFQIPPTKLGGSSPSSCAMRFQYLSLLRFGVTMHKKLMDAKRDVTHSEKKTRKLARTAQERKDELVRLREKIKELERVEDEYKVWKKREPEVRHYLKSFAAIARENDLMKKQLLHLGYDVPRTEWSMKSATEQEERDGCNQHAENAAQRHPTRQSRGAQFHSSSSRTVTIGADSSQAGPKYRSSSSSRKRTHEEYTEDEVGILPEKQNIPFPENYNATPPLQHPCHQFEESHQRPSYRYQVGGKIQSTGAPQIQVYHESGSQPVQPSILYHQKPPLSRSGVFMISGALTPSHPRERQPLLPDSNHHNIDHLNKAPRIEQFTPLSRNPSFLQPFSKAPDYLNLGKDSTVSRYPQPTTNGVSFRPLSRSSAIRQHLTVPRSGAGKRHYQIDSGSFSNTKVHPSLQQPPSQPYCLGSTTPAPTRQYIAPSIAIPSPFFSRVGVAANIMATPRQPQSRQIRPEVFVSGARHFRMQPPASPMRQVGQSLNSLSFINSPYTTYNQRVIKDCGVGRQPYTGGRAYLPTQRKAQALYTARPDNISNSVNVHNQEHTRHQQYRRHISDSMQSQLHFSQPPRRAITRDDDLMLLSTIRGAKSGVTVEMDGPGRRGLAVLPFSRMGISGGTGSLFSAGGRSSGRR